MDGVGTPIIGRPRPLPGHDTPNPAYHPHTLNYEEPFYFTALAWLLTLWHFGFHLEITFGIQYIQIPFRMLNGADFTESRLFIIEGVVGV